MKTTLYFLNIENENVFLKQFEFYEIMTTLPFLFNNFIPFLAN